MKKFVTSSKWWPFKKMKYWTELQFGLIYEKIVPNYAPPNFFHGDDVIDDVTGWPQSFPLYSCLREVGCDSKLQGQWLVNKCKYHNGLSRLHMPKDDFIEWHFSRLQVKGQHRRLTGWPWHLNGHNSANLGIIKMKQKLKCKKQL